MNVIILNDETKEDSLKELSFTVNDTPTMSFIDWHIFAAKFNVLDLRYPSPGVDTNIAPPIIMSDNRLIVISGH